MTLLALDTTLGYCSAAIYDTTTDELISSECLSIEKGHAEHLLPIVEKVVSGSTFNFSDIKKIAVTVGPGSFTGLRVALSAAKAFSKALHIPLVGVSTLSAMAAPYMGKFPIVTIIDARHGNYFAQIFLENGKSHLKAARYSAQQIAQALPPGKCILVGKNTKGFIEATGKKFHKTEELVAPDILWVAKLGALAQMQTSPAIPLYLKEVEALTLSQRGSA